MENDGGGVIIVYDEGFAEARWLKSSREPSG